MRQRLHPSVAFLGELTWCGSEWGGVRLSIANCSRLRHRHTTFLGARFDYLGAFFLSVVGLSGLEGFISVLKWLSPNTFPGKEAFMTCASCTSCPRAAGQGFPRGCSKSGTPPREPSLSGAHPATQPTTTSIKQHVKIRHKLPANLNVRPVVGHRSIRTPMQAVHVCRDVTFAVPVLHCSVVGQLTRCPLQ